MIWLVVTVVAVLLLRLLLRSRVSKGLLQKPQAHPPLSRADGTFGLFDTWYASHPGPHQHAHSLVVKDVELAVRTVVRKLKCLQLSVTRCPEPEFVFVDPDLPLPMEYVDVNNSQFKDWKEVVSKSCDTTIERERGYLWRLHVVDQQPDEKIFIFTFNHLVTDGQGAVEILSVFLSALVGDNTIVEVSTGPTLESVLDVRPSVGYLLNELRQDKFGKVLPQFSHKNALSDEELSTGMEFVEVDALRFQKLYQKCRENHVTLNTLLMAAHSVAYILTFNSENSTSDLGLGEWLEVQCAVSLRKHLLVDLPKACGGNYITESTIGRHTEHLQQMINRDRVESVWSLATSIGKEQKEKFADSMCKTGLIAFIDQPIREWMLEKAKKNSYYGRTYAVGVSNLTRVDDYFSPGSRQALKAMWFAQSNRDAFGPLLESCVETFNDTLRIVVCYLKPALSPAQAQEFVHNFLLVLEDVITN